MVGAGCEGLALVFRVWTRCTDLSRIGKLCSSCMHGIEAIVKRFGLVN